MSLKAPVITLPSQLAAALRDRRVERDLTQKEAGANVGLLPKTISALETTPGRATVESLFKLLSALDLELVVQPKSDPGAAPTASQPEW